MYTVGAGATVYRVSVYYIYCIIYIYIRVYVNKSHTIASATDGFYADIQIMFGTVYNVHEWTTKTSLHVAQRERKRYKAQP